MPRRGWSSITTPSGWYEVIRGPRPPSVQWPLAPKGQGKGKGGKPVAVPRAPQKIPQKAQSKVGRLEAALQALGQEQSSARSALEEALKTAKAEVPKQVHPQQRVAEASARVERLEAALKLLGEDDPHAEPLKIALKRAKSQAQVRPVGERLDLCLQYIARVKKTSSQGRGARPRSQGSPGSVGGEIGQWVARFGGPTCRSVGRASTAPPTECRDGGGTQRGDRQVASSGRRAPEGTCARGGSQSNEESKNIGRELHRSCALPRWTLCAESIRSDVDIDRRSRFHSQGGWQRCPVTPRFHWRVNREWFRVVGARYGMRGVRVGEASHPGPPDHDEWTAPESVIDALEADLTPPVPSTTPVSVGAVTCRMQGDVPAVQGNRFALLSAE